MMAVPSRPWGIPSFQTKRQHIDRLSEEVLTKSSYQRFQELLFHRRDRGVLVTALAEERVRALLDRVGFEQAIHAEALARGAEYRQQRHRHRAD